MVNEAKKQIALMGYSGHGYVCIDVARMMGLEIAGYHERDEKTINPFQLNYLGNDEVCQPHIPLFVGVGENEIRQKIYEKMKVAEKFTFETLIHPSAIISNYAEIGENTLISAGVIINVMAKIGVGCIINSGAIVEHECEIEDFAHIAPGATLAGNVRVGKRSFIGANSSIKQGVIICDDVIIGMGATVLKNIDSPGTYIGSPAKKINK